MFPVYFVHEAAAYNTNNKITCQSPNLQSAPFSPPCKWSCLSSAPISSSTSAPSPSHHSRRCLCRYLQITIVFVFFKTWQALIWISQLSFTLLSFWNISHISQKKVKKSSHIHSNLWYPSLVSQKERLWYSNSLAHPFSGADPSARLLFALRSALLWTEQYYDADLCDGTHGLFCRAKKKKIVFILNASILIMWSWDSRVAKVQSKNK